jgi:hypothetical protein
MEALKHRSLQDIAREIERDWPVINNQAARQALDHMKRMGPIDAPFHLDPSGYAVVGSFLEHARGWKGTVAQRIKKELRLMCGHPRP